MKIQKGKQGVASEKEIFTWSDATAKDGSKIFSILPFKKCFSYLYRYSPFYFYFNYLIFLILKIVGNFSIS